MTTDNVIAAAITDTQSDIDDPNVLIDATKPGAIFRIQNKYLHLTYAGWLDKAKWMEWIEKQTGGRRGVKKIEWMRLAHETGDKNHNYNHTHCAVKFYDNFSSKNPRIFDYESPPDATGVKVNPHPHIQKVMNMSHWNRVKEYIAKEDPENADLRVTKRTFSVVKIWNEHTLGDALVNYAVKPSDVPGIAAAWKYKPNCGNKRVIQAPTRDWQKCLIEVIKTDPDDRHILWVYDKDGGAGKTTVIKNVIREPTNDWTFVKDCTRAADFSRCISNALDGGWTGRGLFVEMSMSHDESETQNELYSSIEAIKDGIITSSKYDSKSIEIPVNTWVVVFANRPPRVGALAEDRWIIWNLNDLSKMNVMGNDVPLYKEHREISLKNALGSGNFDLNLLIQLYYNEWNKGWRSVHFIQWSELLQKHAVEEAMVDENKWTSD